MKLIAYLLFIVLFLLPCSVSADHSFAPSNYYPIEGAVSEGSIITVKQGKYVISDTQNDLLVIGVITTHPAITQKFTGSVPFHPVITSGIGYVLVSAKSGPIKKGDFITTSTIPGVGQKATEFENTIGIAEESFNGGNGSVGKIPVMINIRRVQMGGILERGIDQAARFIASEITPNLILKLSLAGTVVLSSIALSFRVLSRTSAKHSRAKKRPRFFARTGLFAAVSHVVLVMCILYAGFTAGTILMGL